MSLGSVKIVKKSSIGNVGIIHTYHTYAKKAQILNIQWYYNE